MLSGGWCWTSEVRSHIVNKELTVDTLPYHWDSREKYYEDYSYLTQVYEAYLEALSLELDKTHGEKMGSEYWRILAGPALYTILCHLLDRWYIAQDILHLAKFDRFFWIDFPPTIFTPRLTIDLDPDDQNYNHFLISSALFALGIDRSKGERLDFKSQMNSKQAQSSAAPKTKAKGSFIKSTLAGIVRSLGLIERNKVVIVSSYLPRVYEILLNLSCRSVPLSQRITCAAMPLPNQRIRATLNFSVQKDSPFYTFVSTMLPALLPTYLIEGYGELQTAWKTARWPHAPRTIFTSNAFQFNEVFQHYAATQKIKHGSKLVIGQHGGVSGILKWSFGEDHQVKIADKFISWGWGSSDKKIARGVVFTNFGGKIQSDEKGCLLLTTVPMRRYSHKGGAWPVGPQQSEAFLSDQLAFYETLEAAVASETILRIHTALDRRFGSGYLDAWLEKFPAVKVDDSKLPIRKVLRKTRLFVYTYNSTGYLESLAMNFPTVMFWDPNLFETNLTFTAALAELERVGVFHRSPKTAARQINRIWHDVNAWWSNAEVQEARRYFVDQFARQPGPGALNFIRKVLVS